MKKSVALAVVAVAVAATASAAWWPWGRKTEVVAPAEVVAPGGPVMVSASVAGVASATVAGPQPVQMPEVSATLPPGHPLQLQPFDRVLGKADAPVTIIEYASLSCPHCAHFANDVLPQVQRDWIDTGKAKYVFRDLPWDNLALGMSKVTRCAAPEMFYPMVAAFFANQEAIEKGVDTLGEIKKTARLGGLDGDKVEACIKDEALHKLVLGMKETALGPLGVKGTPTSFVNGIKVDGAVDYDDFKKTLEQAYTATQAVKGAK